MAQGVCFVPQSPTTLLLLPLSLLLLLLALLALLEVQRVTDDLSGAAGDSTR
jgi:hypothetical protein